MSSAGQVAQNDDIELLYGKRVLLVYPPVAEMCSSVAEVVPEITEGRRSRSPYLDYGLVGHRKKGALCAAGLHGVATNGNNLRVEGLT